jgi:hypothetical protein
LTSTAWTMGEDTAKHRVHIEASHGSVSSLYRAVCETCHWIGVDSKCWKNPEEEARRHVEGRPMPLAGSNRVAGLSPLHPPLPGWSQPKHQGGGASKE